jgi:hypothetical protein
MNRPFGAALVAFTTLHFKGRAMPKVNQLTISCQNTPGTLARITGILAKAKVNIRAFNAGSAGAMGWLQLIVDNSGKAKKALKAEGISCYEERVLHVSLPNVPGALSRLATTLAARDINIGAGYQTTVEGGKKASVVLAVSHLYNADRIR